MQVSGAALPRNLGDASYTELLDERGEARQRCQKGSGGVASEDGEQC